MRLHERTAAVVTGAGSGIGLAIAQALAERGCRLALIDIHEGRLEVVSQALSAAAPVVSMHPADVSDEGAVAAAAHEIRQQHGPASLLVNSAGVSVAGPFADTDAKSFDWVVRVNFDGTVRCCSAFLPQLMDSGGAHIVTIASCFGWFGFPGKAGYCASKFAVRGFSEALRAELRLAGIGVTVVYPGPVATNLIREGRVTDESLRAREGAFLARRGIPPERVAARVLRGIERNAPRVVVGRDYRMIDVVVRLAPSWSLEILGRLGRRFP